jgi:hypothetical protein
MLELLVTYFDLLVYYIPTHTHSKDIYNQLFANYIHLIIMPKLVDIYAFDQERVQKF